MQKPWLQTGHLLAELQANRLALERGCEIRMQRGLQNAGGGNSLLVCKTSTYTSRLLNGFFRPSRLCKENTKNEAADKEDELPRPHLDDFGPSEPTFLLACIPAANGFEAWRLELRVVRVARPRLANQELHGKGCEE